MDFSNFTNNGIFRKWLNNGLFFFAKLLLPFFIYPVRFIIPINVYWTFKYGKLNPILKTILSQNSYFHGILWNLNTMALDFNDNLFFHRYELPDKTNTKSCAVSIIQKTCLQPILTLNLWMKEICYKYWQFFNNFLELVF